MVEKDKYDLLKKEYNTLRTRNNSLENTISSNRKPFENFISEFDIKNSKSMNTSDVLKEISEFLKDKLLSWLKI